MATANVCSSSSSPPSLQDACFIRRTRPGCFPRLPVAHLRHVVPLTSGILNALAMMRGISHSFPCPAMIASSGKIHFHEKGILCVSQRHHPGTGASHNVVTHMVNSSQTSKALLNASREELRERHHLLSLDVQLQTRSSNGGPADSSWKHLVLP
jgi:hypothetical protein